MTELPLPLNSVRDREFFLTALIHLFKPHSQLVRREFLCAGDKLLFREGRTKGLGIVKSLGYDTNTPLERDEQGKSKGS